jgi:ferrous iron transport protein B
MGIQEDNWPATVGLLTGAVAKEIVIGTLNGAYSREQASSVPAYRLADVPTELLRALSSVPRNAALLVGNLGDPLGLRNVASEQGAVAYSGASQATLRQLGASFTVVGALAYLIFVLLYIPCVSTMGAIRRETGSWRWTIYAILWGIAVAYALGTLFYQLATLPAHPTASLVWSGAIVAFFVFVVRTMAHVGKRTGSGGEGPSATPYGWGAQ